MSNKSFDYQFCVNCGNPDIRHPFGDGHKQCNDRNCLQEFWDDVDYGELEEDPSKYVKKLQHKLEIQTKRVENLKKSNEFYAEKKSWRYSGNDRFDCNISYLDASDVITGKQRNRVGGKLARSCQAIDQELEKELENLK